MANEYQGSIMNNLRTVILLRWAGASHRNEWRNGLMQRLWAERPLKVLFFSMCSLNNQSTLNEAKISAKVVMLRSLPAGKST